MEFLQQNTPIAVAVIGDLCLDLAYQVTVEGAEVSVETALQSFSVESTKATLGGACNVALNCKVLGAEQVDLYGIVGSDIFAPTLFDLFDQASLGREGVITQENEWSTHVYHKVFEGSEEHPRYDSGNFNIPTKASIDALFARLEEKISSYSVVIINEQVPQGIHSEAFQKRLNACIAKYPKVLWIADCRSLNAVYKDTIHKLNDTEGERLLGKKASAEELYTFFGKPVVMTLGERGAEVADGKKSVRLDGIAVRGRIDTVGAGDAFLGGFATSLARGASLFESARVGNLAAAVSVKTLYGCGNPTVEEILALSESVEYRYNADVASDSRLATYYKDTPIEIIDSVDDFPFPEVAIFDHDGTISVLREGWEPVMEQTMITAITGERYSELSLEEIEAITVASREFISATTGIQTIEQMHYLVEMVAEYGYVPEDKILSPEGYKELYNIDLLKMVDKRVAEITAGRLKTRDVVMKGSVEFLHYLHKKGVTLYLASGTDQADVIREATLLGYADLFAGRILGSVGDVDADPKQVVIGEILASLDVPSEKVAIFGDGPVEMREGRKRGLLSVGILSDEVRRYGVNPAKRKRLIEGGSRILIPDFSYHAELLALLGWEA